MKVHLHVGTHTWELHKSVDIEDVMGEIAAASANGSWAAVKIVDGGMVTGVYVLPTPGVPIAIMVTPDYEVADTVG